jgi:hypothetical protein
MPGTERVIAFSQLAVKGLIAFFSLKMNIAAKLKKYFDLFGYGCLVPYYAKTVIWISK